MISNLPFLLVGAAGMGFTWPRSRSGRHGFRNPAERWPYFAMFAGVFLTAFGSAYYHWAPGSARLVWDRLPMTIAFASLVAALISERISPRWGVRLLPGFIALAATSVLCWYVGELRGNGDLRFYAAVQGYAALALLLAALVPSAYSRRGDFLLAFALYVAAKILEIADHRVFQFGHLVSGHSLKHLASALAAYWLLRMLKVRRLKKDNRAPRRQLEFEHCGRELSAGSSTMAAGHALTSGAPRASPRDAKSRRFLQSPVWPAAKTPARGC